MMAPALDFSSMLTLPDIGVAFTAQTFNTLLVWSLIAAGCFHVWKMSRHRITVEQYEFVKGGFVIRSHRYRRKFNKSTKIHELVPMYGKEVIPDFDYDDFHKDKGFPFFGSQRSLKLVRINRWTYKVIVPPKGGNVGAVEERDCMGWVRGQINYAVDRFIKRERLMMLLSVIAPLAVILGCTVVVLIVGWQGIAAYEAFGEKLAMVGDAIIKVKG